MKRTLFFLTLFSGSLFAQLDVKQQLEMKQFAESFHSDAGHAIQAAPYSATVVNESVQTLADGNRIVRKSTGTTARDSEGRTRNDAPIPMLGNMSATGAPHLVFIVDPVAQKSYTLNLDDKTAHALGPRVPDGPLPPAAAVIARTSALPSEHLGPITIELDHPKIELDKEQSQARTEDLGTQVMEGVTAQGIRTTRTIPAGEAGNEKPIDIVTEVWTSSDLKTIVMSKRSDPRTGEQTFRLTNISRAEPDPALFAIPADFKTVEGPGKMFILRDKE